MQAPTPPRRFVVLSTQRSGTTWVIDMLNSHPSVSAYGELFVLDGKGRPPWGARDMPFWETYRKHHAVNGHSDPEDLIIRYLDRLYAPRSAIKAIGFKLMYGQSGAHPDVLDYLRARGASVIHLIRRNYLDIIISKETAVLRNLFSARDSQPVAKVKIRLDPANLIKRIEEQQREPGIGRRLLSAAGLRYVEVYYEDLAAEKRAFGSLLSFLGIAGGADALRSVMRKLNSEPQREILSNYEAVRQALEGTAYREFLR